MREIETEIKNLVVQCLKFEDSSRRPTETHLREMLERAFRVLKVISEADLGFMSAPTLDNLRSHISALERPLSAYFESANSQIQLSSNLDQLVQNVLNQRIDYLTLGLISNRHYESYLAESRTRIDGLKSDGSKIIQEISGKIEAVDKTIAAAKQYAADSATAAHATEFELESKRSQKSAFIWLGLTAAVGGIALLATYKLFIDPPAAIVTHMTGGNSITNAVVSTNATGGVSSMNNPVTFQALQSLVARVVFVSFLYFFVVWSGRNYAASRHNQIVNRHRRNAMQTFKAFTAATNDPATKEFILRQAVACAFAPQQSGYLKDEALPDAPPLLVDATKLHRPG